LNKKQKPLEYVENDFKNNGDGTITDLATGLMWEKSGSPDTIKYENAKSYVATLNQKRFAGHKGWRLPTVDELVSLLTPERMNRDLYIDPIFDKAQSGCWTSDQLLDKTQILFWQRTSGRTWYVHFNFGSVECSNLNVFLISVRAVRSA